MIALDAMFSPVLRVRYKVDGTRVGQETNLDKLSLTVETDGTMTPREAFRRSCCYFGESVHRSSWPEAQLLAAHQHLAPSLTKTSELNTANRRA